MITTRTAAQTDRPTSRVRTRRGRRRCLLPSSSSAFGDKQARLAFAPDFTVGPLGATCDVATADCEVSSTSGSSARACERGGTECHESWYAAHGRQATANWRAWYQTGGHRQKSDPASARKP
jgi:hypothetical protein